MLIIKLTNQYELEPVPKACVLTELNIKQTIMINGSNFINTFNNLACKRPTLTLYI